MNPYDENRSPEQNMQTGEPSAAPQEGQNKKVSEAAAVAFVLFFILDIIAMAVFAQLYPPMCMACFGVLLLIIGITAVRQTKINWDSWPVLAFPLIGLALTVLPVIDFISRKRTDQTIFTPTNIGIMISSVFLVVGLLLLIMPLLKRYFMLQVCTEPVMAECIDLDESITHGSKGVRYTYAPKWRYVINGVTYEQLESTHTNQFVPEIGDNMEIYVNPNRPNQIYRKNLFTLTTSIVFGAFSIVMSLVAFYFILFVD